MTWKIKEIGKNIYCDNGKETYETIGCGSGGGSESGVGV
jgi:hypothetical protein